MFYFSLIVIALLFLWRMGAGYKKGMVQEIISVIAMIVAGCCVVLILGAVGGYLDREIGQMIKSISVLFTVCIVYRFANVLMTSIQLISKLPLIKWVDKLLGVLLGAAEAVGISMLLVHFLKQWGLSVLQ